MDSPKFLNVIHSAHKVSGMNRRNYATVQINGCKVKLQLDTASGITRISRKSWGDFGRPVLISSKVVAQNASDRNQNFVGVL